MTKDIASEFIQGFKSLDPSFNNLKGVGITSDQCYFKINGHFVVLTSKDNMLHLSVNGKLIDDKCIHQNSEVQQVFSFIEILRSIKNKLKKPRLHKTRYFAEIMVSTPLITAAINKWLDDNHKDRNTIVSDILSKFPTPQQFAQWLERLANTIHRNDGAKEKIFDWVKKFRTEVTDDPTQMQFALDLNATENKLLGSQNYVPQQMEVAGQVPMIDPQQMTDMNQQGPDTSYAGMICRLLMTRIRGIVLAAFYGKLSDVLVSILHKRMSGDSYEEILKKYGVRRFFSMKRQLSIYRAFSKIEWHDKLNFSEQGDLFPGFEDNSLVDWEYRGPRKSPAGGKGRNGLTNWMSLGKKFRLTERSKALYYARSLGGTEVRPKLKDFSDNSNFYKVFSKRIDLDKEFDEVPGKLLKKSHPKKCYRVKLVDRDGSYYLVFEGKTHIQESPVVPELRVKDYNAISDFCRFLRTSFWRPSALGSAIDSAATGSYQNARGLISSAIWTYIGHKQDEKFRRGLEVFQNYFEKDFGTYSKLDQFFRG